MNPTITPTDLLDHTAQNYAAARKLLAARVETCKAEQDAVIKRHLQSIRDAAGLAAQAEAQLRQHIEANPDLFIKPRTMTLHGVKLGYQKGKGRTEWPDDDTLGKLVHKHLGKEAVLYLQVVEIPIKAALQTLDADTLKKLGYRVTGTDDQILIKDSAAEVDKIVARLLTDFAEAADGGQKS